MNTWAIVIEWRDKTRHEKVIANMTEDLARREFARVKAEMLADIDAVQIWHYPAAGPAVVVDQWSINDDRSETRPCIVTVRMPAATRKDAEVLGQFVSARFGETCKVAVLWQTEPIERMREAVRVPRNIGGEIAPEDQA